MDGSPGVPPPRYASATAVDARTITDKALEADWLGAVPARRRSGCESVFAEHPATAERAGRDRPGRRRRPDAGDRPRGRGRRLRRAGRAARARATSSPRSPRSAATSPSATARAPVRVVIDPIDGSLNAKRLMPDLRAQHRGRVRRHDGGRRVRATSTTSAPARSSSPRRDGGAHAERRARSTPSVGRARRWRWSGFESARPEWLAAGRRSSWRAGLPDARGRLDRGVALLRRRRAVRRHGERRTCAARSTRPPAS